MAITAKGQPNGLATLDENGRIPGAQVAQGAAVADVASADADLTYGAEEQALVNECKSQLNELLASLRAAGLIDT